MKYKKLMTILLILLLIVVSQCSMSWAQGNYVYIDQVGNNNQFKVEQDGTGHVTGIAVGAYLPANANDLKTGYTIGTNPYLGYSVSEFNNISVKQTGPGIQTTKIELPSASGNLITVDQSGSANHTFNITSGANTTNINNTITATQSGSAQKEFTLNMNGTNGAQVTVQQTNPTQANTGSMTIQCTTCGAYNYVRQ
jgi:hypothetical protein